MLILLLLLVRLHNQWWSWWSSSGPPSPRIISGEAQILHVDVNKTHNYLKGDRLPKYGWLRHDGVNFGLQEIRDTEFHLNTTFVKQPGGSHGGDWTARFTVGSASKVRDCRRMYQRMNEKEFYLFLYSMSLRTLLFLLLDIITVNYHYHLLDTNFWEYSRTPQNW